jgi:hypothetical protein
MFNIIAGVASGQDIPPNCRIFIFVKNRTLKINLKIILPL